MDGCPFSELEFKYVASYLLILLFVYFSGYRGNATKPAFYHQRVVKVEMADVQIDCRLFKLVTGGLYVFFKKKDFAVEENKDLPMLGVEPSPPRDLG